MGHTKAVIAVLAIVVITGTYLQPSLGASSGSTNGAAANVSAATSTKTEAQAEPLIGTTMTINGAPFSFASRRCIDIPAGVTRKVQTVQVVWQQPGKVACKQLQFYNKAGCNGKAVTSLELGTGSTKMYNSLLKSILCIDPCAGYSCGRGLCVNVNDTASCKCEPGYPLVSNKCVDPCEGYSCGHGACVNANGTASCECEPWYQLVNNTCIGPCEGYSCGNGACVNANGTASCECEPWYQLVNNTCIDPCEGYSCGNGACVNANGIASCECEESYSLVNNKCVDPCAEYVCARGFCANDNGKASCKCGRGFLLVNNECVVDICGADVINPCLAGTCINGGRWRYTCVCPPNYGKAGSNGNQCGRRMSIAPPVRVDSSRWKCEDVYPMYGLTLEQFTSLNPGVNCSAFLPEGQELVLNEVLEACSARYYIQPFDTCLSVSRLLNMSVEALQSLNPGYSCSSPLPTYHSLCVERNKALAPLVAHLDACPVMVRVTDADTCKSVAHAHKITMVDLLRYNAALACRSALRENIFVCVQAPTGY